MRFEHFALNVPDARAMSRWYVDNVGFVIARRREEAPYTHFLADETGHIVVELYTNTTQPCLEFPALHPLLFHFAVVATDARAERVRLEKAGAALVVEETLPDGTILVMMRDPWGVPLQLCQRATPFPGY
jgi:catechol 2,3-dioxygenase-like lactoylglutathione lyase family enzyme